MYPDRLVIMNPGGLMPGLTTEQLREDPHRSEKRNPLIAEACFLDYWVERYGTGTTRMIEQCRAAGLPEPEFRADPEGFSVAFRRDALTPDLLRRQGLNERQIQAVLHVKEHGQITSSGFQKLTGASRRTATNDLTALDDRGLLRKIGERGPGTHYVLAEGLGR
jgi:ATP-dependent DNA helicase RecG